MIERCKKQVAAGNPWGIYSACNYPPPRLKNRHNGYGFNLVEAAIVLGVIGLVIGGIWAAASAVRSNLNYSRTQSQIISLHQTVYNLFAQQNVSRQNITAMLASSGMAPGDMIQGSSLKDAWGGNIVVEVVNSATRRSFGITFDTARSTASCMEIVWNVLSRLPSHCAETIKIAWPTSGNYALGGNGTWISVSIARQFAQAECSASNGRVGLEIPFC